MEGPYHINRWENLDGSNVSIRLAMNMDCILLSDNINIALNQINLKGNLNSRIQERLQHTKSRGQSHSIDTHNGSSGKAFRHFEGNKTCCNMYNCSWILSLNLIHKPISELNSHNAPTMLLIHLKTILWKCIVTCHWIS